MNGEEYYLLQQLHLTSLQTTCKVKKQFRKTLLQTMNATWLVSYKSLTIQVSLVIHCPPLTIKITLRNINVIIMTELLHNPAVLCTVKGRIEKAIYDYNMRLIVLSLIQLSGLN